MNEFAIVAYITDAFVKAFENNKTDVVIKTTMGLCEVTNIRYEYFYMPDKSLSGFIKADNNFMFPSGNTITLCMIYDNKRVIDNFTGSKTYIDLKLGA